MALEKYRKIIGCTRTDPYLIGLEQWDAAGVKSREKYFQGGYDDAS